MSRRKVVLFIAEAATLAHIARPLVLARSLDPARYEVHFACADRFQFVFENESFTRWTIQSISSEHFVRSLAKGSPPFDYHTLAGYAEEEEALFEQVRPDLIVGDFRLSLSVSASLAGIPYASITNAHWSPYARGRYPMPDLPMVRFLGVYLSDLIFQAVRPAAFALQARPLNRLRRQKGLEGFPDLRHTYTHADYTLYADVPSLVPTFDLPVNHHYIGPILWSPRTMRPDWWDELPHDRPRVYVTLGSSGSVGLLSRILGLMSEVPVNVVVATAGREQLGSLPDNVWAADYLSGDEATAGAALAICSGGSGTAYQALNAGVPILGLPTNMDHFLTTRYVQEAGAGIGLRADQAPIKAIRTAIETLLSDPSYRRAAGVLAAEFHQYDAAERFGNLLSQWLD